MTAAQVNDSSLNRSINQSIPVAQNSIQQRTRIFVSIDDNSRKNFIANIRPKNVLTDKKNNRSFLQKHKILTFSTQAKERKKTFWFSSDFPRLGLMVAKPSLVQSLSIRSWLRNTKTPPHPHPTPNPGPSPPLPSSPHLTPLDLNDYLSSTVALLAGPEQEQASISLAQSLSLNRGGTTRARARRPGPRNRILRSKPKARALARLNSKKAQSRLKVEDFCT